MSVRLPDDDVAFYLAAANQLPPRERPEFQERVAAILRAHPDNAVRTVLHGLQVALPTPPRSGAQSRWAALGKATISIVDMAWTRSLVICQQSPWLPVNP
jgi:hypothetical protein